MGLLLFTPLGTSVKVWVNRMLAFSPAIASRENQTHLDNYNWTLYDLQAEKKLNFSEKQGKVVFVSFWATWCPPCIAEMPSIQKLYNAYKNKVEFALVTNESGETVKKFLEKHGYTLPVFNSYSEPPEVLSASQIPTSFLIGQDGKILIEKTGSANWNAANVQQLLDSLLR